MAKQTADYKNEAGQALRSRKGALIAVFTFSCLVNLLMLTGPIYMLQVYDRVLTSSSVPTLIALSVVVLGLYLYYGFLEFIRGRIMLRIGRTFDEKLRDRVFDVVAKLAVMKQPSNGAQPVSDLGTVRQFLSGQGPLAFLDMPWVPFYLFVVYAMHPILGIAGICAAITIFVMALLTEAFTSKPIGDATQAMGKANGQLEEARRNAEALYSLGMKGVIRRRWSALQQQALDHHSRAGDAAGGFGAASRVTRLMVQSGMLGLGAYLAILQEITPGTIIASSIIMSRGLAPIEQAVGNWQQFLGFRKAYARLTRALDMVPGEPDRMALPPPRGLLEVENLVVMIQGNDKPLLQGLSFKVEPGRGLGVVGPTGAGKSTLSRVLVGVTEATRGTIRLDGATHDQRSDDERGSYIGYLPQDVQIFDGTVAQNISRFVEGADPDDIVAAAQLANIHDLIMRLPQGYDTPMGEGGTRLSAGQRQRLALARALYGDPPLIVMDEPNSNLDADGEQALDRAVRASLQRGAAVVIVAHRPSALQAVHDILVLTDGKQMAYGPRDEVFKQVTRPRAVGDGGPKLAAVPSAPETRT
jgi:PrtD family type I secretion system ABC transporter